MKTISILGFGLLGASFGLALKGKGYRRICWTRRAEVRQWALDHDAADEVRATPEEAAAIADVTFLAMPIPQILEYLDRCAGSWRPGSIVTDMGSVKGVIMKQAENVLTPKGVIFIGGHPMAGTEKSGCENAMPTMFDKADAFLCPGTLAKDSDVDQVRTIWESLNMRVYQLRPEEHDDLVAHTSHVQHIVASALTLTILGGSDPEERELRAAGCAGGFRDTSRIASSNPEMWREIVENNTPAILGALDNFEEKLKSLRSIIAAGEYDQFQQEFARGKKLRDAWLIRKSSGKIPESSAKQEKPS